MHAGNTPSGDANGQQLARDATIRAVLDKHGAQAGTDPHTALERLVNDAAAVCNALASQVVESGGRLGPHLDALGRWQDRLKDFSKTALDAGIDERRVRMAEGHATRLGEAFGEALEAPDVEAVMRTGDPSAIRNVLRVALGRAIRAALPSGAPPA